MFRLRRWASWKPIDAPFATAPMTAIVSIKPEAISGGADSRCQA